MNLDVLIAATVGLLALAVVLFFLTLIFRSLRFSFHGKLHTWKAKRIEKTLLECDEHIEQKRWENAIYGLEGCITYDVGTDLKTIHRFRSLHQHVLSRYLVLAEERGISTTNVAELERLVLERSELQVLAAKALEAFKKLQEKRESSGKAMPAWSREDYTKKIDEIRAELKTNQKALGTELTKLIQTLLHPPENAVTYH